MPTIDSAKLVRALKKKGFKQHNNDHKSFYFFYNNEVTDIGTCVSHGPGEDLGPDLIRDVYQELYMTKDQLLKFVECTFSMKDYIDNLIKQHIIDPIC